MTPIFTVRVENGKIRTENRDRFQRYLDSLSGVYELIVRRKTKKRSNQQNKWYWSCVVGIPAKHFGSTQDEMHDAYRWMFLRKHEQKFDTVSSTKLLNTKEFSEYCEKIIVWNATENKIIIPFPGEVDISNYEEYR